MLFISVATVAVCNQALSQETTSSELKLDTVVVKGKTARVKDEQSAAKSPLVNTPLSTTTTAKTIVQKNINSVKDLGNTTEPSVSYVYNKRSVNIRGLEDDRILTTIDGIPLPYLSVMARSTSGGNTYTGSGGVDTYDFSSLSRIDIMHGSDSSVAGSGALGGAMLLQTIEPSDILKDGKDFGGVAKVGFDGTDNSLTSSAAIAKKINDTSILLQGGYKFGHETQTMGTVDSYGSTRTVANPMNYYQRSLLLKVRQDIEGGHQLGFTAEHYSYNSSANLKNLQGTTYPRDNYAGLSDKQRDRLSLDYRYDNDGKGGLISDAFATLYWQRTGLYEGYDGARAVTPIGPYRRDSDNSENSFGFSGFTKGNFQSGGLNHDFTLGANLSYSHSDQYTSGLPNCTGVVSSFCSNFHANQADTPQVDYYRAGVYGEDKITLGDSNFSLTPGLRLDWYQIKPINSAAYQANSGYAGLPPGQTGAAASPKLRAAWQARQDVEIYGQFSTAFKSPSVSQLYSNYTNPGLYQIIGNPNLKAETSYSFELGANLGDDDLGGHVAAFSSHYKNFIDTVTTITGAYPYGVINSVNLDNVGMSGVEASAHKKFDNGFNVHGSISYVNGVDLATGKVLSSVPPVKGIIGLGYENAIWGGDVSLVAAGDVAKNSNALTKPKGYGVTNVTAWWTPEQFKGLRIQAGVYNVFNRQYLDALSVKDVSNANAFYSQTGRAFKISITQTF